ncbi:MAG: hypothetical protein MI863_09740 [Desulfobacterales bacterium]|nr:hypothetical protein [Desulfobacterales bacterium]
MNKKLDLDNLSLDERILMEQVNDDIKQDFHRLMEAIHCRAGNSAFWGVNNLLSRNNYVSDLFYDLCCLELSRRLVEKGRAKTVIVRSSRQKKVLEQYFRRHRLRADIRSREGLVAFLKRAGKPVYDFLRNIQWTFVYLMQRDRSRMRKIPRDRKLILIDTFFSAYIFKSGEFKDRYYTGLIDFLTPEEQARVYFMPNVISWRRVDRMIRMGEAARENFIYPFDFLKFRDYLFAIFAPFIIKRIFLDDFRFRGMCIGPILKSDFKTNIALRSSFRGLLLYRFFKRLKKENIKLHMVVDWFENQVVDRGFNKGKNEFFPETPSIGYQGLIAAYKWNFYVQPIEPEAGSGCLPRKVAVIGEGLVSIAKKYYPGLDVIAVPGFRFAGIRKTGIKKTETFNTREPTVLVALPIWESDSLDIVGLLVQVLDLLSGRQVKVLVKPHPDLDFDMVRSGIPNWPEQFKVIEGDFADTIQRADLLISSGSTVCMESIAYGVPVIVVGSRTGVTKNVIPETISKKIWDLCYTEDDIRSALNRLCLNLKPEDAAAFSRLARQVRDDFFKPATRKGVEAMLMLDKI